MIHSFAWCEALYQTLRVPVPAQIYSSGRPRTLRPYSESVTNGFLLNEAGRAAGIDPKSLFRPNPKESPARAEARAMRYASDELKWYWSEHPRLTFEAFVGSADELARVGTVDF